MDSKECSWKWITADELLSHGACELISIAQTSSDDTSDATFYDGEDTNGKTILKLEALANRTAFAKFNVPIYCRRGLYVDVGSNVTGILVQWRELGKKTN